MPSGIEASPYPIYDFIHEHPQLEIFLTLDFGYLAPNRLEYRRSKYGEKTEFANTEEQKPGVGIFRKEAQKVDELITVCRDKNMSDRDIIHLFPALHICFFAHQLQFRESGDPYTVHPIQMAIEAVRDHNADWQTAALCLIHDVKEDSKKYQREVRSLAVEHIYTQLFKGENNENLPDAKEDAKFLARGMEALHKVSLSADFQKPSVEEAGDDAKASRSSQTIARVKDKAVNLFNRKEKNATLETVKKQYTMFLGNAKKRYTDIRIALVKLLDKKTNLETLQYMPPAKQIEKAQEAFIYIAMAEAFHLYGLRDTLTQLALKYLDPAESDYINALYNKNISLKDVFDKNDLVKFLSMVLKDQDIPVQWVCLNSTGYFELYKAVSGDVVSSPQTLDLDIVLDDGQGIDAWREKGAFAIGAAAGALGIVDLPKDAIQEIKDYGQFMLAKVTVGLKGGENVDFVIRVWGRGEYIKSHTSIENIYPRKHPPFGDWEEWNRHTRENVLDIYNRFKGARKLRDFAIFAEVIVAGQKSAFDEFGNRIYLQKDASLYDLLWMIYGDNVKRSIEVYVRTGKTTVTVGREDFGNIAGDDIRIEGLRVWEYEPLREMIVRPEDIRMSRTSLVRQTLIQEMMEQEGGKDRLHDNIINDGFYFLQEDFKRAWTDALGREPVDITVDRFFPVSPDAIIASCIDYYPDKIALAYAIGSGRIPGSVYRRVIDAMVRYREDMVYLGLNLKDQAQVDEVFRILRESGISWDEMDPQNTPKGEKRYRFWFHESQLGSPGERMDKFNAISERLQARGIRLNVNWNKLMLPIRYPPLPAIETLEMERII